MPANDIRYNALPLGDRYPPNRSYHALQLKAIAWKNPAPSAPRHRTLLYRREGDIYPTLPPLHGRTYETGGLPTIPTHAWRKEYDDAQVSDHPWHLVAPAPQSRSWRIPGKTATFRSADR